MASWPDKWVDIDADDPVRGVPVLHVPVFAVLVRALHEFRPDRQCGFRAFEIQVLRVVEADPDDADQLRGEAGEPAVPRSAGFTRCRQGESPRPRTPAAVPLRMTSCIRLTIR